MLSVCKTSERNENRSQSNKRKERMFNTVSYHDYLYKKNVYLLRVLEKILMFFDIQNMVLWFRSIVVKLCSDLEVVLSVSERGMPMPRPFLLLWVISRLHTKTERGGTAGTLLQKELQR